MKNYKYEAEEILEEYVNAYSQVDIERLARKLEKIAKDTAKEIYLLLETVPEDDRHYWRNAYNDRINKYKLKIKERYGVEVE